MSFDALDVAVQINQSVAGPVGTIAQHDGDLARQIRRAAPSIVPRTPARRLRPPSPLQSPSPCPKTLPCLDAF